MSIFSFAQKKKICYAVTTSGDTIKGMFLSYSKGMLKLQRLSDLQEVRISIDTLTEYTAFDKKRGNRNYEIIVFPTELVISKSILGMTKQVEVGEKMPLQRLAKGKLNLYMQIEETFTPSFGAGAGSKGAIPHYYLSSDGKSFTKISDIDGSVLKDKLSDCPALVAKLGSKDYHKLNKHIQKVMEEYNVCK